MQRQECIRKLKSKGFVRSISLLFAASALLAGCQTNQIPDVRVCKEIPFLDAPEGACIWSKTHREQLIPAKEWAALRPYHLVIDPEGWRDIKTQWIQLCQMQGPDCEIQVDSIDSLIRKLDDLAKVILR